MVRVHQDSFYMTQNLAAFASWFCLQFRKKSIQSDVRHDKLANGHFFLLGDPSHTSECTRLCKFFGYRFERESNCSVMNFEGKGFLTFPRNVVSCRKTLSEDVSKKFAKSSIPKQSDQSHSGALAELKIQFFRLFGHLFRVSCCLFLCLSKVAAEESSPDLTLMIPMRDGFELPTDFYFPSTEAQTLRRAFPCILLRSPSGRQGLWNSFYALAKAGFVIAVQDTRSFLDKEGKTLPFLADGWGELQDGYDTVEWLAHSAYTNGKVATWGASAMGITQLLLAPAQPPHLVCQYILVAASSLYHHAIFPGGQLLKNQTEGWLRHYAHDTGILQDISQRFFYNDFWKQFNTLEVAHRVQVPAIHVAGWYDTFLEGTLAGFKARQLEGAPGARGLQKLVIGPWTHFWPLSQSFGDFEVPVPGRTPPFDISPKRWFDHYLKGIDNGVQNLPPVLYYVMGPFDGTASKGNVWKEAQTWPVPASSVSYYLTPDRKLSKNTAVGEAISYDYDPRSPIPTLGGNNLFLNSGPVDQSSIEKRDDVVVFISDPLEKDVEITGDLSAQLLFSSDAPDTDVILRLCDRYPDGKSILIAEGIHRLGVACYADQKPAPMADTMQEVLVNLGSTSMVFAKGHSIALSVSSSNFPRYEKNQNVGVLGSQSGKFQVAKNTVHFNSIFPSRILLPVVEGL